MARSCDDQRLLTPIMAVELRLTTSKPVSFYLRAARSFLEGVPAKEEKPAKPPLDTVTLTALGLSVQTWKQFPLYIYIHKELYVFSMFLCVFEHFCGSFIDKCSCMLIFFVYIGHDASRFY